MKKSSSICAVIINGTVTEKRCNQPRGSNQTKYRPPPRVPGLRQVPPPLLLWNLRTCQPPPQMMRKMAFTRHPPREAAARAGHLHPLLALPPRKLDQFKIRLLFPFKKSKPTNTRRIQMIVVTMEYWNLGESNLTRRMPKKCHLHIVLPRLAKKK